MLYSIRPPLTGFIRFDREPAQSVVGIRRVVAHRIGQTQQIAGRVVRVADRTAAGLRHGCQTLEIVVAVRGHRRRERSTAIRIGRRDRRHQIERIVGIRRLIPQFIGHARAAATRLSY